MKLILVLTLLISNTFAAQIDKTVVQRMCEDLGFSDCKLVNALAKHESEYNSKAYNPEKTGSFGLIQIQCGTAKWMGKELGKPDFYNCNKLYDPRHNIKVAVSYLRYVRDAHGIDNVKYWIAAYNSGKPIICKFRNPGYCNPGEFYNQAYVDAVYAIYQEL